MSQDNLSAILYKPNDLRLEKTPIQRINDGQVLLEMDSVGICGSDVHYWTSGRCGPFEVTSPMIMGHEGSGVVIKIGADVKNLKVGDRVAVEPGVPCRVCDLCKAGSYNLCPDLMCSSTPPYDGNLLRYYVHDADFCNKLPDHVTMEEGALLEPLSVGVHACKRGKVGPGSTVLVLGAGPIGLLTMLVARAMGASKILITNILESRLQVAKELGADLTLLVKRNDDEAELVTKIHSALGTQPNVSFDASGMESTVRLVFLATRAGGTGVLIGMTKPDVNVPLASALGREIDIRGNLRYCNDYPLALSLIASGLINVKPLITHHFDLEQTLEAFEIARKGVGIKVMIHVQPKNTNNNVAK